MLEGGAGGFLLALGGELRSRVPLFLCPFASITLGHLAPWRGSESHRRVQARGGHLHTLFPTLAEHKVKDVIYALELSVV